MIIIWLALPLECRATLESGAFNKQQIVFAIRPKTNSPGARAARVLVNTWLRFTFSGWYVESMHPVGVLRTHVHRSEDTRTIAKETMGQSEYLYLVIDLRVATSATNTES